MSKTQKSKLIQNFNLQPITLQEPYTTLVDMGMWSDYFHKVKSIIFARHDNAHRIICVNDPYKEISIKDDECDLRMQGKAHIPNIYMKPNDPFPSATKFKLLLCSSSSSSSKRRLQKLIGSYLADLARNTNVLRVLFRHCETTDYQL